MSMLVSIDERPDLAKRGAGGRAIPGVGDDVPELPDRQGITKFMGDPERGPWVYYTESPAGDRIPMHKHTSNRVEFLFKGRILWHERGQESVEQGAGTMSYVEAGTVYGYDVLDDAVILVMFDEPPGINFV